MDVKEGQYFYKKHRNMWGVWKKGKTINGVEEGTFITDFCTQIQAKNFVYKMNGWQNNNLNNQEDGE